MANFTWYQSYTEAADCMPNEEARKEFIVGLVDFAAKGIMPDFKDPCQKAAFCIAIPSLEKSIACSMGGQKSRKKKE